MFNSTISGISSRLIVFLPNQFDSQTSFLILKLSTSPVFCLRNVARSDVNCSLDPVSFIFVSSWKIGLNLYPAIIIKSDPAACIEGDIALLSLLEVYISGTVSYPGMNHSSIRRLVRFYGRKECFWAKISPDFGMVGGFAEKACFNTERMSICHSWISRWVSQ
jgi:hypothetical protein